MDFITIIECPRDGLEQALTAEQKGSLLEIFGCDELEIKERTVLILTEPLYVSTREMQKRVYRDMVASLREDGYIPVIKPIQGTKQITPTWAAR